jgi:hypothetical protein
MAEKQKLAACHAERAAGANVPGMEEGGHPLIRLGGVDFAYGAPGAGLALPLTIFDWADLTGNSVVPAKR